MINDCKGTVFSLSRFFHGKKKILLGWVAGRFYPEDQYHFRLQSQGLSINCKSTEGVSKIKTGHWIAVKLLFKKNNKYQISEYKVLSSPECEFEEAGFSYTSKGSITKGWDNFLSVIKEFFYSRGLACVDTPSLVSCPGTEPHLQVFKTRLFNNGKYRKMYLPTSPEMHLKKLLCQDWTDFFEIKKCYRNGESGKLHQAEFTLLEWYRAFYSTKELMEETCALLSFLQKKKVKVPLPEAKVYTVQALFKKFLNFSLTPQTSKKEIAHLLKKNGLIYDPIDTFESLFFNLFLNLIEPKLPKQNPVFICHYPPQLRAFSKINEQGWADRFELYWRGLELANAFYEVTDSEEQLSLFKEHIKQRQDSVPMDKELLLYMKKGGMPPCSGIAVGLDRLFLALYGKDDLTETRLFPLLDTLK